MFSLPLWCFMFFSGSFVFTTCKCRSRLWGWDFWRCRHHRTRLLTTHSFAHVKVMYGLIDLTIWRFREGGDWKQTSPRPHFIFLVPVVLLCSDLKKPSDTCLVSERQNLRFRPLKEGKYDNFSVADNYRLSEDTFFITFAYNVFSSPFASVNKSDGQICCLCLSSRLISLKLARKENRLRQWHSLRWVIANKQHSRLVFKQESGSVVAAAGGKSWKSWTGWRLHPARLRQSANCAATH